MVCAGITYNAEDNTIWVKYDAADGTKGASFDDPYTLQDIYDTDVANGWGVINKLNDYYHTTERLYIKEMVTYFHISEKEHIYISNMRYNDVFKAINTHLQFGELTGQAAILSTVEKRATMKGEIYLYNVVLNKTRHRIYGSYGYTADVKYLYQFYPTQHTYTSNSNIKYNYVDFIHGAYGFTLLSGVEEANNIRIFNCIYGLYIAPINSFETTYKNISFIDCNYDIYWQVRATGTIFNFVDSEINTDKIIWLNLSGGDCTIILKTTFNATIENASGGELTIEDKDGNVVYSETLSSDDMSGQEIVYYSSQATSPDGDTDLTINTIEKTPFTIKVTKSGYQPLSIPGITVSPGNPTNVYGKMEETIHRDEKYELDIKEEKYELEISEEELIME